LIAYLLRFGVLFSGAIVAVGTALVWIRPEAMGRFSAALPILVTGGAVDVDVPRSADQVISGLLLGTPQSVISLGLLVLIGLPVLRVALTVVLFVLERDRLYTVITLFVLAVLITSISLGKAL
jgi:uncharacterized membrane protein